MLIAQLSDCHLAREAGTGYRGVDPDARLAAVVARIAAHRPELVIVSGDVSDDGSVASYHRARALLDELPCCWEWLPGNHDDSAVMHGVKPLTHSIELGGWQFVLLDSRQPDSGSGYLAPAQLEALSATLEKGDAPALVVLHHPPVSVHTGWMDRLGLENSDAFWQTLAGHDRVRGVLCGHVHHEFTRLHHGVPVMALPAVAAQFVPESTEFSVDEQAPCGFRLLHLDSPGPQAGFLTRVERLPLQP
ncbi:phosphodiesterase [Kushneria aurantia]|uniref:Phosphodiesterase n=1 Tax=Kushneria aurantia TaxID=504092 RepID=A0ABV6G6Y8_9GAMM|nr:phosphodiesterase [Kushneria aurantia]